MQRIIMYDEYNQIDLHVLYLSNQVPFFKLDVLFAVYKIDANLKQQELSLLRHNFMMISYAFIIYMML